MLLPAKNVIKQNALIANLIMDFMQQRIPVQIKQNVQLVLKIAVDVGINNALINAKNMTKLIFALNAKLGII